MQSALQRELGTDPTWLQAVLVVVGVVAWPFAWMQLRKQPRPDPSNHPSHRSAGLALVGGVLFGAGLSLILVSGKCSIDHVGLIGCLLYTGGNALFYFGARRGSLAIVIETRDGRTGA
jgi:drug/metabolite transporter (DMT)-like permease